MVIVSCDNHSRPFRCADCDADPAALCWCILHARDYERSLIDAGARHVETRSATGSLLSSRDSTQVSERKAGSAGIGIHRAARKKAA